jgi:cell pole-organizing protein PopZ
MEEILSSIKRIIAEDSEAALSAPRVKRSVGLSPMTPPDAASDVLAEDSDVLELTDPVAIETPTAPVAEAKGTPMPKPATMTAEPAPIQTAAPVKPEPAKREPAASAPATPGKAEPASPAKTPSPKPELVSSTTVEASRSSLAALSALIVKPEITGSDTLEGLVRDMIKPMLAEWLDARLPDIVDRMVAQEIARITARG